MTSGLNFIRPPNGGIYTLNATPWIDYKLNFYCYQGGELIGLIKNVEVTLIEQISELSPISWTLGLTDLL